MLSWSMGWKIMRRQIVLRKTMRRQIVLRKIMNPNFQVLIFLWINHKMKSELLTNLLALHKIRRKVACDHVAFQKFDRLRWPFGSLGTRQEEPRGPPSCGSASIWLSVGTTRTGGPRTPWAGQEGDRREVTQWRAQETPGTTSRWRSRTRTRQCLGLSAASLPDKESDKLKDNCNLKRFLCLMFQGISEFALLSLSGVGQLLWTDCRAAICHESESQLASKNVAQLEDRHGCKFGHWGHRYCFACELVSEIVYCRCYANLVMFQS